MTNGANAAATAQVAIIGAVAKVPGVVVAPPHPLTPVRTYPALVTTVQVAVLPITTGFGVQLTDPPAAMFTVVVTGSVFTLKAAVTVQTLVIAMVTYGLLAEAAPQLLVVNPVKV